MKKTKKMKKQTNKLLLVLASFIGARAFMIFIGGYTEGAIASFIGCIVYVLLFLLFSPRTRFEKTSLGVWKSLFTVLLFVLTSFALSSFINLFFEVNKRELSLLQGAVAVFLVPIAEELFFRATLFKMLDTLVAPLFSVFFSSLIFALSHEGIPSIIAAFILGAMLSLVYKKTGSLKLPVICHIANNLLSFVVLKGF